MAEWVSCVYEPSQGNLIASICKAISPHNCIRSALLCGVSLGAVLAIQPSSAHAAPDSCSVVDQQVSNRTRLGNFLINRERATCEGDQSDGASFSGGDVRELRVRNLTTDVEPTTYGFRLERTHENGASQDVNSAPGETGEELAIDVLGGNFSLEQDNTIAISAETNGGQGGRGNPSLSGLTVILGNGGSGGAAGDGGIIEVLQHWRNKSVWR